MKTNFLKTVLIALLPICVVSCIPNVPEEEVLPRDAVSFDYYIDQNTDPVYYLDFYVDSDITFKNTSPETTKGDATWDFGDGTKMKLDADSAKVPVIHYYTKAGTYRVKLTIGEFTKEQNLMIAPIKPIVKVVFDGDVCEVRNTPITFDIDLPNPKNKPATFTWRLPKQTRDSLDKPVPDSLVFSIKDTTEVIEVPSAVKMWHVGSQKVQLNVVLGGEELEPTFLDVQVAYNKEVPTLYYAEVGKTIKAHKLANDAPADMEISSYDLGVSSGQHPLNILFHDTLLYVLDAGKQFYYVNDADSVLGDGKISVVAKDGSKVQTMISNDGQFAFWDPFYGCIDGDYLYYANRNIGIVRLKLTDRDKVYSAKEFPDWVNHNTLGYYGSGIAFGAIGGMFGKVPVPTEKGGVENIWHWTKFYNANGIFRFTEEDILKTPIYKQDTTKIPKAGIMLTGMWPKAFVYTAKSPTPKFVFSNMDVGYNGVYAASYAEMEAVGETKGNLKPYVLKFENKVFESATKANQFGLHMKEGYDSESIGICQLVYDEITDCVYFAYRNNIPGNETKFPKSGIYSYNVGTGAVTCLVEGVEAYGVTVNSTPSKLF